MAQPSSKPEHPSAKRPPPPVRPLDTTDVVLTPGGLRPRSLVHQLEPGQHVSVEGGRVRIIETATGKVVKDLGESAKAEEGEPPSGPARAPRRPADGAAPSGQAPTAGPVPALQDVGWIENAQWNNTGTQPIVSFTTTWVVPPASASSDSQTVFLFNALQPNSAAHILQPVLQWGPSAAGGGNYWSITNWYADGVGGASVYQSLQKVNPGDVLQGVMTCTGKSSKGYSYTSSFAGYPSLDVTVTDVDQLTWAFETLEAYRPYNTTTKTFDPLSQCSDYPDTTLTAMYDIEIRTGTPGTSGTAATVNWFPVTSFTDCGQSCVVVSNDSPGGAVYLYYRQPAQAFYFLIDKGTFGKDEVTDAIAASQGTFPAAFYLALEGFTVQQLTIDRPSLATPNLAGAFTTLPGVTVAPSQTYARIYDAGNLYTPQRILFPYDITFTSAALAGFPASGILPEGISASIDLGSAALGTAQHLQATAMMFLVAGANPYFTNIDPAQHNVFYLSQDLRVFTITPTANKQTPIDNVPFTFQGGSPTSLDTAAAYAYIRDLVTHFNNSYSDPSGTDPFDAAHSVLPGQVGAYTGDSTVTPATPNPTNPLQPYLNYNFALARVRLRGTSGSSGAADDVRVFFRAFTTQTFDTDYINVASAVTAGDPNITYPSLPAGSPDAPTSPLPGTDAGGTINGCTLPFFAAADQSDLAAGGVNDRTIEIPAGRDAVWAYFGCFLNVYDSSLQIGGKTPQQWLAGSAHNCIVAQIAYAGTPIKNVGGVIENPENSDKLAQRNLQVTPSGNPGYPATHLIPQTFDTRPSPPPTAGVLTNYPDELMIDWGGTPRGSTAEIYWPQVKAGDVLALARRFYGASSLAASDSHTIRCTVGDGATFIPIPLGGRDSFAGLLTVQLPDGVRARDEFRIVIRRVTSRRLADQPRIAEDVEESRSAHFRNWRYVVGTFQIRIPVESDAAILPAEENLLAILKWRLQGLTPVDRWYPVLQRYVSVVSDRVSGLGGDPDEIQPSPLGTADQTGSKPRPPHHLTGKISGLRYDRFGDFVGFDLITLEGDEHHFHGREPEVESLVHRAWAERILLTVVRSRHSPDWPHEILLRRPPRRP